MQPTMIRSATTIAASIALASSLVAPAFAARDARATSLARLGALEDGAERIAEGAPGRAGARAVASRWPTVRITFAKKAAAREVLADVDSAIAALRAARDAAAEQRAANEVTGALAPLFGIAGDRIPVGVHFLDYLGRSIKLDAVAGDWDRAATDRATLLQTWAIVRPLIAARRGGAVAARTYDGAADAINTAVNAHDASAAAGAAQRSWTAVDGLQRVYGA